MSDGLICVENYYQLEALRRVSLALLALALGVFILMRLWGRRRFGPLSPTIVEACHKGYAWSDIDRVYAAAGHEKLAVYRSRQLPFDRLFALIYGVAATVTGVWVYADACRGIGERWFALSLIAIGLFAMLFDWLEGSALRRVTLAWEEATKGGDLRQSLALTASRRTVTKFWLFLIACLQAVWFHVTELAPSWELALALVCGLVAGVFLGKPNPDLPAAAPRREHAGASAPLGTPAE
ncbi:MAG: hypothetical protein ABWZ80_02690 [Beijerinckiaceae bacterium]